MISSKGQLFGSEREGQHTKTSDPKADVASYGPTEFSRAPLYRSVWLEQVDEKASLTRENNGQRCSHGIIPVHDDRVLHDETRANSSGAGTSATQCFRSECNSSKRHWHKDRCFMTYSECNTSGNRARHCLLDDVKYKVAAQCNVGPAAAAMTLARVPTFHKFQIGVQEPQARIGIPQSSDRDAMA